MELATDLTQSIINKRKLYELENGTKVLDTLLNKDKKEKKTQSVTSLLSEENAMQYAMYTRNGALVQDNEGAAAVSKQDIWNTLDHLTQIADWEFNVNGQQCHVSQIEKVDTEFIQPIKAENNVVTLKEGIYYGMKTSDGTNWAMSVSPVSRLSVMYSEDLYAQYHGENDDEAWRNAIFVSNLAYSGSTIVLTMDYSKEEIQEKLADMGIEQGFFTINCGKKSQTFYYSGNGNVYPKYQYDGVYDSFTNHNNLDEHYAGDCWTFGTNTYEMDEEGHLNMPYGEDLFDCKSRPRGKVYEQHMKAIESAAK